MSRQIPNPEQVDHLLHGRRNWNRWGPDDEMGAVNLIGETGVLRGVAQVRLGRALSLARPFPKEPAANNLHPAQHFMRRLSRPGGGGAVDYYGISYHGQASTHLDALGHVWDDQGMWNGRDPDDTVAFDGLRFGSIDHWRDGIITKGVLLDVPRHRGVSHVTLEDPVHGDELEAILETTGVTIEPGDAIVVHSGREAWDRENALWGSEPTRPGLHASCLAFVRDHEVAVLVWDMMDATPNEYGVAWTMHGVVFAYGVALVDNALLEPLATVCLELGRNEFMLALSPLVVSGGTGSPINPLAVL